MSDDHDIDDHVIHQVHGDYDHIHNVGVPVPAEIKFPFVGQGGIIVLPSLDKGDHSFTFVGQGGIIVLPSLDKGGS